MKSVLIKPRVRPALRVRASRQGPPPESSQQQYQRQQQAPPPDAARNYQPVSASAPAAQPPPRQQAPRYDGAQADARSAPAGPGPSSASFQGNAYNGYEELDNSPRAASTALQQVREPCLPRAAKAAAPLTSSSAARTHSMHFICSRWLSCGASLPHWD